MIYLYHVNVFGYHECRDQVTIGRTTGDIICGDDGRMSGKHAQVLLVPSPEGLLIYVEDLGSKNRTVLNRQEIPPLKQVPAKTGSLLEVGSQQFIITENPKLSIADINEIMDRYIKRAIVKLDVAKTKEAEIAIAEKKEATQEIDGLGLREQKVLQLQKDIATLEQKFKTEMQKLEDMKERLFNDAKAKKEELAKRYQASKADLEDYKVKLQKHKDEVEQKKKKLINLKDLPKEDEKIPS